MSKLSDIMWKRHRHPWSGWSRVVVGFAMGISLWHHEWWLLGATCLAALTNPFWFPAPKSDRAWMTRAVDGERIWLNRVDWLDKVVVFGPSTILTFVLIWALYQQDPIWTAITASTVVVHKFLFLFFCVRIADQH